MIRATRFFHVSIALVALIAVLGVWPCSAQQMCVGSGTIPDGQLCDTSGDGCCSGNCNGNVCCEPEQTGCDSGTGLSMCCPGGDSCCFSGTPSCCGTGTTCALGGCCPSGQLCGGQGTGMPLCCPSGTTCTGSTSPPSCVCATPLCNGTCCASDETCSKKVCTACGGGGEVCCSGNVCDSGFGCKKGMCVACGGVGQPCCGGSTCNDASTCKNGTCRATSSSYRCTFTCSGISGQFAVDTCDTRDVCGTSCPTTCANFCQGRGTVCGNTKCAQSATCP